MKLPASDPGQPIDTEFLMNHRPLIGQFKTVALSLIAIAVSVSSFPAHSVAEELTSGTSSRKARQNAIQSIPFQELNQQTQNKIQPIIQKPSIYRRLPVTMIDIDPEYFVFLARYPEVIVNIWKIMGVTKMSTTRTGPFTISTNDGVGTISNVELVYGTNNQHVFYGEGTYEGPVLRRKLRGECVLVLNTQYKKDSEGKKTATSQLDVFLKIENATAGMIAKTLNPIVGSTADHNFVESLNFLQRLNETTEKNGVGVQRMANRLTDINPETRQKFIEVAGAVYERSGGTANRNVSTPAPYAIPAYPRTTFPTNGYNTGNSTSQNRAAPISESFGQARFNYGQPAMTQTRPVQTGYAAPGQPSHYGQPSQPMPLRQAQPAYQQMAPGATREYLPMQTQPRQHEGPAVRSSHRGMGAPNYPGRNYYR